MWLSAVAYFLIGALLSWGLQQWWQQKQNQRIANALLAKETEAHFLEKQVTELKETEALLRMELNEIGLSNSRLETLLEESQKLYEAQQSQFESLSLKTLETIKNQLEEKANRDHQHKQALLDEKLSDILKPLKEIIVQNEKKVEEIEKQHIEDTASLKKHIELIVEETGKLVGVKNKLAEALSNSKGRGDWGEMELVRLLENSGLMPGVHYEAQKQEDGLRPDIVVKLSNQRILYIDAKTILVNLERLFNATDSEEEAVERKKHAAALEKEILSLSAKAYESRSLDSIDFVILYVPRESMLRVALEEKPTLMEQAFQKRVILASPLVLMAILKTVAYGWDQAQLSKNAQEISLLGKELHKRAATFWERFERVGDKLTGLNNEFESTKTAFSGRMGLLPQIKKLEAYGCKSEKTIAGLAGFDESEPVAHTPPALQSSNLTIPPVTRNGRAKAAASSIELS